MGTKDLIVELLEQIESQKFNYILGIIKPGENTDELEITTNLKNEPISQLIKILREHQKTVKVKSDGSKEK